MSTGFAGAANRLSKGVSGSGLLRERVKVSDTGDSNQDLFPQLLTLGQRIMTEGSSGEDLPVLLEQYANLFERWYTNRVSSGIAQRDELEQVQLAHDSVLAIALEARSRTEEELKGIRGKGKAILAYVDTLPKQIATARGRKG